MLLWFLCLVWGVRQPTLCYLALEFMYVNQSSLFLEFPCSLLSTIHLSFLHHPFQPNNPYPSVSHDHIQLPTAISSKAHQPKTSRGYTPLRALKRIHAISEPSQPIHLPIFFSESKKATFDSAYLSHPKTHYLAVPFRTHKGSQFFFDSLDTLPSYLGVLDPLSVIAPASAVCSSTTYTYFRTTLSHTYKLVPPSHSDWHAPTSFDIIVTP